MPWYVRMVVVAVFVLGASGCAILDSQRLLHEGKEAEALDELRRALGQGDTLRLSTYSAHLRARAIEALGHYERLHGVEQRLDDEALRYFNDGLRFADDAWRSNLNNTMAMFYSRTQRLGRALPYARAAVELEERRGSPFGLMVAYEVLASIYDEMGERGLARDYRQRALDSVKTYFVIDLRPTETHQWAQYAHILEKLLDFAALGGNREASASLWKGVEAINARYMTPKFVLPLRVSLYFAMGGQHDRAREIFALAGRLWNAERSRYAATTARVASDFACIAGDLALYARRFRDAVGRYDECRRLAPDRFTTMTAPALRARVGRAYEGVGDLQGAAAEYRAAVMTTERTRDSYDIRARTRVLSTHVRDAYWGLTRVLARRSEATGVWADVAATLDAAELMRARRLGDTLRPGTPFDADELRRPLAEGTALVTYTTTDAEMIVIAVTRTHAFTRIVPYDAERFRRGILAVSASLASPESRRPDIESQLMTISETVVRPIADLLPDARRLVVVPDGFLSLVPFDLLSSSGGRYRALIEDHEVTLTPSLRSRAALLDARPANGTGLAALGDPVNHDISRIADTPVADLRAAAASRAATYFTRLPETRREVESIAALFAGQEVRTLLGPELTKAAVMGASLERFGYIHIATHGIVGGDVPGIGEPALVLSGDTTDAVLLKASDVEAVRLNASLVVLSACKTGAGDFVTGEGVLGMGRAFLVAGSRSVVMSLWSVESFATEELMVRFYRHLRSGVTPAAALRRAKLELRDSGELPSAGVRTITPAPTRGDRRHPFYWAAFTVFGAE